ncbi:MAG: hypothetical protein AB1523_02255 [Bacillota bacterium]
MTLTRRRKEFLAKIMKIYARTGEPVHYATVAQSLGVSKWTAYDVLRELEKEGLLIMEYAINREERFPGRSQVLFRPTPVAVRMLEIGQVENLPGEDWLLVKKRLLGILDNIKNLDPKKIIDELLEEMHTIEKPITYSAYTIALLTAYLSSLGNRGIQLMESYLHLAPRPELILSLFAGTVLGVAIKSMKEAMTAKLATKIEIFQKHVSEFSRNERKLLVSFLGETLQRATV